MIVNEFKASTLTIGWRAQEISETLLVRISGKRVYRDLEFEEDQKEHRVAVQQKLVSLHRDVIAIMTNSYEVFKNDGSEVGALWPGLCGWGSPQAPKPIRPFSCFFQSPPPHPSPQYVLLKHPALFLDSPNLQSVKPSSFWTQSPAFLFNQPIPPSSLPPTPLAGPTVFPEDSLSLPSSHQIQQQWMLYTIRLDHMMEDALRLNVKWSLLELSKAINGDGKTSPNPLFRVLVILQNDMQGNAKQVGTALPPTPENDHTLFSSLPQSLNLTLDLDFILWPPDLVLRCLLTSPEACLLHGLCEGSLLVFPQVEFSPTLQTLANVVNDIGSHLFSTISVFRHLPEILLKRKFFRDPIHLIVGEWAIGREFSAGIAEA